MVTLKACLFAALTLLGCATSRPALRSAEAPRITDSPAERLAAMPVPDPAAAPENKDARFGLESAAARDEAARRQHDERSRCVDVVSKHEAARGKPPCPRSRP